MTAPSCPKCKRPWTTVAPEGWWCSACDYHLEREVTAPEMREAAVDAAALLDDVVAFIHRYVILNDAQAYALALWTAHTHAIDAADATPYININSPEPRSGKTKLEETLSLLVRRSWFTGRVTAAVLVRKLAAETPTLLLDESDAAFRAEKEYAATLQAILNSGYRRGGCASLCVKAGGDFALRDFQVFGAKAIAGIGKLPDTVADRSISITLKRRAPNEPIARFRRREVEEEGRPIHDALACWASANIDALTEARPDLPPELDDRAGDVWEPLLAIADLAGGDWPKLARQAALVLSVGEAKESDSLGVRLLQDARAIFEVKMVDRISTAALITALLAMDEAPWGDLYGKALDARGLARRLRPYGLKSHNIRLPDGTTPKGYETTDFHDPWGRYCTPGKSATSATSATTEEPESNTDGQGVADVADVADFSGIREDAEEDDAAEVSANNDDDLILQELIDKPRRHYLYCLGLELGFPRVVWPSNGTDRPVDGIPEGRFYYEQAARYWPDPDIERAIVVLEAMGAKVVEA